jgi:membrane fusion protein (multidrug efflux system)
MSALEPQPHVPPHDEELELPEAAQPSRAAVTRWLVVGVGVLVAAFAVGFVPRARQQAALARAAAARVDEAPRVLVARPRAVDSDKGLALPGTVDALHSALLYARTSGYLVKRLVDIGDRVKEGQLLALIETPELDEQIMQARAALAQTKAAREQARTNLEFARISLERIRPLTPVGVASQQDFDQKQAAHQAEQANVTASDANIAASEANLRRLTDLKNYSRVTAPFAGTVVERSVDVGSLITAGNGTGQSLFKLAASNPVRVFVSVPQSLAPLVQTGQKATVTVRQYPGRTFAGTVTRDARALDQASRTLLTEIQVPNDDEALLPGMYAQIAFATARSRTSLLVDGNALVNGAAGPRVAVVDAEGRAHFRAITIDVDYGPEIAVATGVDVNDRVILNPDSALTEGAKVRPIERARAAK